MLNILKWNIVKIENNQLYDTINVEPILDYFVLIFATI